ncbi:MAG TPA: peptide chain release factor 1, partial [Burkholderiales bacterium]|nr:peptide chain release factor 1 [Burkholderiales bacterium]
MKPSLRSKLDGQAKRLEELNRLLSAEDATRDMDAFRRLSREHAELAGKVEL